MKNSNLILCIGLAGMTFLGSCQWVVVEPVSVSNVSYATDVQPIFSDNCTSCHGGASPSAGLNLTDGNSRDQLFAHAVVDTTDAENSKLYKRMTAVPGYGQMPPTGILASSKTAIVLQWIVEGAKDN